MREIPMTVKGLIETMTLYNGSDYGGVRKLKNFEPDEEGMHAAFCLMSCVT